ncbi:uncharacterized protein LOC128639207 isoform X2 [Bombina bombina]|uniref:uncharacterized protein LOC128639207 isoform X2 n=1 Tax=Bombina bombina TaxID=8345 RepID=UPI00235B2A95|nr:uncharacterized protein LOC128639207 isoform X2 [Bombina bombina]
MAGPFRERPMPGLVISPLGVVPKKDPGKFRMIQHLSYPKGKSVNDAIPQDLSTVYYQSFDDALQVVRRSGQGALLAKLDIESAFRLLPIHPASFYLMGCFFNGHYYVDRCLPMGCSISCAYFEAFSSFLHWAVAEVTGEDRIAHYLDDFLLVGRQESRECELLLYAMRLLMEKFGVPLAEDKTEGPCTCLTFLGIEIDSVAQECRLPVDKVRKMLTEVRRLAAAQFCTLKELQSVLGLLNFAGRVIPMGRIFLKRMERMLPGVTSPKDKLMVNKDMKEDHVWDLFLSDFNGICIWRTPQTPARDLHLFTDAAGGFGYGAYFNGEWSA